MAFCYRITGLMSGSSLDGVDLACCEFIRRGTLWDFRILAAETLPYPAVLKAKLGKANQMSMDQIEELDLNLGDFYADQLNSFHEKYGLRPALISSHGHTIRHEPHRGITLQAGNGRVMARHTGIKVVNDFRREDVAQGGQGAPLVPVGDRMLFGSYEACINLGGFSNISYDNSQGERIAYDIGPANLALNWIAGLENLEYDLNGRMAKQGQVSKDLLSILNQVNYYRQAPPKSLGKEWFLKNFQPLLKRELDPCDLMATTAEHIAIQLAGDIHKADVRTVLLTGGGALNQNLVERLKHHAKARIEIPDLSLIQYKEALVFAFLGLLRMLGEINCLASVTGGQRDLSTGCVHA